MDTSKLPLARHIFPKLQIGSFIKTADGYEGTITSFKKCQFQKLTSTTNCSYCKGQAAIDGRKNECFGYSDHKTNIIFHEPPQQLPEDLFSI